MNILFPNPTWWIVLGAFSLGMGVERGWLPGVGLPFWVHLLGGSAVLLIGLTTKSR